MAELGLTPANIQAVYAAQMGFGVTPNYGSNWNVNAACGPGDPFGGAP